MKSYDFPVGAEIRLAYAVAWICDRWKSGNPLPSSAVIADAMERELGVRPSKPTVCRWKKIINSVRGVA